MPNKLARRSFLQHGLSLGVAATLPGLAQAADQGPVIVYNGQHKTTTLKLLDAFTAATGIRVESRKGSSIQLANQIIEEGERSPADLFYSEESPPMAALAERGLLAPLQDATLAQVRKDYRDPKGFWTGVTARCRVTAFNKSMIKEGDLPDSVLDMATPAWKGRVAFVPTSGAFQQQIVAISSLKGRDAALNWLKGLKRYGEVYGSNKAAMAAVERGDIATALINNYYWYNLAQEKGMDKMQSALHFSGNGDPGALVTVSAAGVLKSSKQAQAAQQLVQFMTGVAGQEILARAAAEWPMNPQVAPGFGLKPFEDLHPPKVNPANLKGAEEALQLRREAGLA
ncbi:MAG: extracellular solute-binding protein [Comamonas sp.]|nr:extracellular solute-binding protein [Comamonas sp.]